MKVDVAKSASGTITQSASVLYLKLNHTASDIQAMFTEGKVNGNAPFGGATGSHVVLRERFNIKYGTSLVSDGKPLTWTGVQFVRNSDASEFIARLQQDQFLLPTQWYLDQGHLGTFGTNRVLDLLTTDIQYFDCRLHSLCSHADVERILFSHLQGRISFADYADGTAVSNEVLSYEQVWNRIYAQSSRFQSALSKYYDTPISLGDENTRYRLNVIVAKAVAVDLVNSYNYLQASTGTERYRAWAEEVEAFLKSPPQLEGCDRISTWGGSIRVERA